MKDGRKSGLSIKDSIEIDSILLYTPKIKHISYLENLLEKIPPHPQYYHRIKELFIKEHNLYALRALARYKKTEDYKYILDALHGKVQHPIDLKDYAENEQWFLDHKILVKPEFAPNAIWEYDPDEDGYNNPKSVRCVALECIYECPAPIFQKYQKEAATYIENMKALFK